MTFDREDFIEYEESKVAAAKLHCRVCDPECADGGRARTPLGTRIDGTHHHRHHRSRTLEASTRDHPRREHGGKATQHPSRHCHCQEEGHKIQLAQVGTEDCYRDVQMQEPFLPGAEDQELATFLLADRHGHLLI